MLQQILDQLAAHPEKATELLQAALTLAKLAPQAALGLLPAGPYRDAAAQHPAEAVALLGEEVALLEKYPWALNLVIARFAKKKAQPTTGGPTP